MRLGMEQIHFYPPSAPQIETALMAGLFRETEGG